MQYHLLKKAVVIPSFLLAGFCAQAQRVIQSFDNNWKFIREDVAGAEKPTFNDAVWRTLNVPHDWSVEGTYDRANPSGRGGGFVVTGTGWYRKAFTVTEANAVKKVFIAFDGVMMNSEVWVNGNYLGKRPYGYISFQYDITKYLNIGAGKTNIIAVKADNSLQPASRWYSGSGIYRHVHLIITHPVHVAQWGTFVTTPSVSAASATVQIETTVANQSAANQNITIETTILAPGGAAVATTQTPQKSTAGKDEVVKQKLTVVNPALWDVTKPQLYTAKTQIKLGTQVLDEVLTPFGIRDIHFEAATGFWLNGVNTKIKGVCLHHDGGAVGAAVPLRVWERRFEILKSIGVNAIRTSHNPVAPEFLDLCDKMGFLVMDETLDTWNAKKSSADYGYNVYFNSWWEKDTRDQVLRDRNHPSIFIYSVGNEIHDNLNDESGFKKYKMQQDLVHSLDPTRKVTMALFRPALSHVYENGLADAMDVVGQNYRENELVAAHESKPARIVIGTENGHTQNAWLALRDKPYLSGQFLWTGIDYLGENDWPNLVNGQGLVDRTGAFKTNAYQRQSWWSSQPMVHVMRKEGNAGAGDWISDWSPTDIDTYDEAKIQVFSNCDEVELFLNGKSHGVQPRPDNNASPRTWSFPFEKGTLHAVAKNNGKVVATQELKSAGVPAKIILKADKTTIANNWDDVSYITATVTDENGIPCLTADNRIIFDVKGAGVLAATDNGDLTSTESFLSNKRFAFKGACVALVKANAANGKITITATADKLATATLTIDAAK